MPAPAPSAGAGPEPDAAAPGLLRRNYAANVADGAIWSLGIAFASVSAILPVYVSRLTSSQILIGLIPALVETGWYLPQLFTAPFVSRLRRVKPLVLALGLGERLPFLAFGLVTLGLAKAPTSVVLAAFFAVLVVRSLASGLVATGWQEMIARVIPPRRRGEMLAMAATLGGVLSLGGSVGAREVLARLPHPINFAVCFLIAFAITMISWLCLTQVAEPPIAAPAYSRTREFWRSLPRILRQDGNFRRYSLARIVGSFGGMAPGFLAVAAFSRFDLGDEQAAVFSGILFGVGIVANPVWGWLGVHYGNKLTLELSSLVALLSFGAALVAPSVLFYYLSFAAWGAANAGFVLSTLTLAMEFGAPAERPTYIGLTHTVRTPVIAAAPLLGGWVASAFGYPALFGAAMVPLAASIVMLRLMVTEPRPAASE